jgi:hypothetical protein
MEPIKFKNETPEITAMREELSELLKQYEKGKISYNACVGMGMKLALKILQEATKNKNDN